MKVYRVGNTVRKGYGGHQKVYGSLRKVYGAFESLREAFGRFADAYARFNQPRPNSHRSLGKKTNNLAEFAWLKFVW